MTYEQKYKTAEERVNAFSQWCADRQCNSCVFSRMCGGCDERTVGIDAMAHWLALEAEEEKPLPCPFCGSKCEWDGKVFKCTDCQYRSSGALRKESAIAAHNRVAKAVMKVNKDVK